VGEVFQCREIVYSVFSYERPLFLGLSIRDELEKWEAYHEENSSARPIWLGSPFDDRDGNLNLDLEIKSEVSESKTYVVIYYFYEEAFYRISGKPRRSSVVSCDPILADLNIACAMNSISTAGRILEFECDSSYERSETLISFFLGTRPLFLETIDLFRMSVSSGSAGVPRALLE